MKFSLLLLSALVSIAFSTPVSQLFDPFGDFLQGNILNNNGFYAAQNFSTFYRQFASNLENEELMANILKEFKQRFNKLYKDEAEAELRLNNLKNNLLKVFQHNADANNGKHTYTLAVNQFSDMSIEEIINSVTGYWPSKENKVEEVKSNAETSYYADSTVFDPYRGHIVAPIQNQGSCGACVYFAAAAVVESSWARKGHPLTVLSTQQLNDCAHNPARGNNGCQHGGGTFVPTFDYIKAHGLTSMQNYPYLAKDDNCNKQKESQVVARISSWTPVTPHGSEDALKNAVEQHGPVAVAIHVSDTWAHYRQGIYDDQCQGGRNHAVLVVGYGHDAASNKDFWIVKNQWGEGFGEHGYIRMRRNNNNMCDISGDAVWVASP